MAESKIFTTPVGRLLQGDLFVPNTKDMQGNPLTNQNGEPREDYYIAVAFDKQDPGFNDLWSIMQAAAQEGFPGGQSQGANFSWKLIDGDTAVDRNNKPYSEREGFAGHWVVKFSTSFAPEVYDTNCNRIVDKNAVKRGYYIMIHGSTVANGQVQQPGIYMNYSMVQLVGYGNEIRGGADPHETFANRPAYTPAGMTNAPAAPAATPAASAAPAAPATASTALPAASAPVSPHNTILPGQ